MQDYILDEGSVIKIATRFLEQHYSGISAIDATLNNNVWAVTLYIGMINPTKKIIKITADTGRILEVLAG